MVAPLAHVTAVCYLLITNQSWETRSFNIYISLPVLASQQLMASAAEHAVAAVETLASAFASAVVVLDAAEGKGYSSYWCLT